MYRLFLTSAVFIGLAGNVCGASRIHKRNDTAFSPLKFNEDGTFQLTILEDLHFGDRKPIMTFDAYAYRVETNKGILTRGHSR